MLCLKEPPSVFVSAKVRGKTVIFKDREHLRHRITDVFSAHKDLHGFVREMSSIASIMTNKKEVVLYKTTKLYENHRKFIEALLYGKYTETVRHFIKHFI